VFWLLPLLWAVGGAFAAVASEVARAERPALVTLARLLFALALGVELLGSAAAFAAADSNAEVGYHGSHTRWLVYALGGGVPLTLLSGFLVRRGFAGLRQKVVLAVATLAAAGLYIAFPYAYAAPGVPLHGLALWAHRHHLLAAVVLVTPTALLLLMELSRGRLRRGHGHLAPGSSHG
jgi:hypothetical protein